MASQASKSDLWALAGGIQWDDITRSGPRDSICRVKDRDEGVGEIGYLKRLPEYTAVFKVV